MKVKHFDIFQENECRFVEAKYLAKHHTVSFVSLEFLNIGPYYSWRIELTEMTGYAMDFYLHRNL